MITVSKATFSYGNGNVFENINLDINKGEIFCLFGPNGCGKSTLIQCILGILRLSSGSISLRGRDVSTLKPQEIAREVAYIPQMHEKPFPYKVIDIVLMGRAAYTGLFSIPSAEDRRIAEEVIEMVGLTQFSNRPYTQLSGGETQLVLVARALAQQTPILIMDEPTAHLDFRNELSFLETITRLVREIDKTIIMATHYPNHAVYFEGSETVSEIGLMNNQKIAVQGAPGSVLTEGNMAEVFNIESKVLLYEWMGKNLKQLVPLKTREPNGGE
jgi:iron complex transport system ATP-binding protein